MSKLNYLTHIDSVRAVAVLLVILFHLDIELFKGGFIGVDVFFVISGFLITRLLNHEFSETGTIDFWNFYKKRIRRLMPTLFLTIGLTFLSTFLVFSPSDFMNATKSMFMSSIALANFHFLGESDYFDTSSELKPLLHTWSLGIEEQFYLLFPITLFLLLRIFSNNKRAIISSLTIFLILSLTYTIYSSINGVSDVYRTAFGNGDSQTMGTSSFQFFLLPFRLFEFIIGAIIALIKPPRINSEKVKLIFNLVGFSLVLSATFLFDKNTSFLSSLNVIPCIGVGILLFFPPSNMLLFFYDNKLIRYVGKISYTLYLIHWLVIVIYRYLIDREFGLIEQIMMFVIMFGLSALIYEYYEKPLRYTKARFSIKSDSALIPILLVAVLSVNILKIKVNTEDGWIWRLSDKSLALIEEIGIPKDYHKNNWGGAGYKPGWIGDTFKGQIDPDMIWLGDSHAGHYLFGLDSIMSRNNKRSTYIPKWFPSRLNLPDLVRANEDQKIDHLENYLELLKKHEKSTVVLSYAWVAQIGASRVLNKTTSEYEKIPNDSSGWQIIAQKIEKFHDIIGKHRNLVIIGETPRLENSELNYINKLSRPKYLLSFASEAISTFQDNRIEFNSFFKSYFDSKQNIEFLDPSKALCESGTCVKQSNNLIFFSDNNHLTRDGAVKVIQYLEQRLLTILDKNSPIKGTRIINNQRESKVLSKNKLAKVIENPKEYHKSNWGGAGYETGLIGEKNNKRIKPDMIWLGDTHAMHYKSGLERVLVKKNNKHVYFPFLANLMRIPDIIFTGRGEENSKKFTNSDLDLLKKNPESIVVLSHSWINIMKGSEIFNEKTSKYEKLPEGKKGWLMIAQKIVKFHKLIGKERKMIILGDTPGFGLKHPYVRFENNRIEFNSFFKSYFESIENIEFLDPSGAFCENGMCLRENGESILYSDNTHFSKEGSTIAIEYIEKDLLRIIGN